MSMRCNTPSSRNARSMPSRSRVRQIRLTFFIGTIIGFSCGVRQAALSSVSSVSARFFAILPRATRRGLFVAQEDRMTRMFSRHSGILTFSNRFTRWDVTRSSSAISRRCSSSDLQLDAQPDELLQHISGVIHPGRRGEQVVVGLAHAHVSSALEWPRRRYCRRRVTTSSKAMKSVRACGSENSLAQLFSSSRIAAVRLCFLRHGRRRISGSRPGAAASSAAAWAESARYRASASFCAFSSFLVCLILAMGGEVIGYWFMVHGCTVQSRFMVIGYQLVVIGHWFSSVGCQLPVTQSPCSDTVNR